MSSADPTPGATEQPDRGKVLVVEDSEALRELYTIALERASYDVQAVPTAESALEIAGTWRPDLVLTDLFMPGLGGLELITRLRSDLTPPVPPLVVISGFPDAKPEALRRGAARFEIKPVSVAELVSVVEDVLGRAEAPRLRPESVLSERRAATRALGEAALDRLRTEDPGVVDRLRIQVDAAAKFIGHSAALVFLLREGELRLVASSDPRFPLGASAADVLPILNDVVESESRLVVAGVDAQWLAPRCGGLDVRFLVAVPYLVDRAAVGVICLVDDVPHEFGGAGLATLEYMTRRGAAVVRGGPSVLDASGLYDPAAFAAILDGSMTSAHDAGRVVGFTMYEVDDVPADGSLTGLFKDLPGPGVMIGVVDRRHLAAFSVAESVPEARERLLRLRRQVQDATELKRTVELTHEDPVPVLGSDTLVARGRDLLACAVEEGRDFLALDCRRR